MSSTINRKPYKLILILVCALLGSYTYGQYQYPTFIPVEPETLSNSYARCFFKDSKGYMWFGMADGLIRYDGTNMYRYEHDPEDKTSISHNNINVIIEDSYRKLWIGTSKGLCRYDREKDNFINIDSIAGNKNYLNNSFITSLSFDKDKQLWIGTYGGGINIYDSTSLTFSYINEFSKEKSPIGMKHINTLLCVGNLMWCGTKGGLRVFNTKGNIPASLKLVDEDVSVKQVTQLTQDVYGNIWLATLQGEVIKVVVNHGYYYSFERNIFGDSTYGANWNTILTISSDHKGNLWVGGENSGLNCLDTKNKKVTYFGAEYGNTKSLPTNSIRSVYIDDTGLMWIGTFKKGIYLINNNTRKFDSYKWGNYKQMDLEGKDISGFVEDDSGNIWIACESIGLIKLDSKTNELQRCDQINQKLNNKYITALAYDSYGNLWLGTGGNGVYKVNIRTGNIKSYSLESGGFGDNKISYLYQDKSGTIWAGTNGSGLFYFDKITQYFKLLSEENKSNYIPKTSYVSSILESSDGVLWVGTMYGLYELKRENSNLFKYRCYLQDNKPKSLSSNAIQTLFEDNSKNLWIGTEDNGLNVKRKDSSRFKAFHKSDGLVSKSIRAILKDSVDNLWISGNMGLSKFNPQTGMFTNYTTLDGLACNSFYNNSRLGSSTGKFFFGSNNGFNAFYPDSIQSSTQTPVVYLTDLKINNQSVSIGTLESTLDKHISLTSQIELSHKQRSFTIDFVAINYGKSSQYEYCYMLEGFDKNWNCIGKNHSATYTNIGPGNYVFLVKTFNYKGISNNSQARLEIKIKPVLWKTWWAMLINTTLLGGLLFFLIGIRMERIKMKNQLIIERSAREREHELSESKTQFFTNISHEFRTPLSLISMPLENLNAMEGLPLAVKERINTIRRSSDKMMRLVNELMDFNKLESTKLKLHVQEGELVKFISEIATIFNDLATKKNIHFGIHSMIPFLEGWFDHDKLEKILVNILSNAFKFTSNNGQINIIINSNNCVNFEGHSNVRCLEIKVIDNGVGISEKELPFIFDKFYQSKSSTTVSNPGTGIGLSLTKGLVELHQGSIKVESISNKETQFIVFIPIDRKVFFNDDLYEISDCVDKPVVSSNLENDDNCTNDWEVEGDEVKPQILVVEDNDELRKYISLELKKKFKILMASNGQQGLDIALKKNPDLIISDIIMPVKTGIELCNEIKSNLETSHIPIILLTAKTTVNDQVEGIETGADAYITKPFSIRFLIAQVDQIIESRQKLYSQFSQDVYLLPNKVTHNKIDEVFLQKAIDYIMDNIQDSQLGVNSLANLFNLSRMQVYRKIKALTGKSVVSFIRMVRIKQSLKFMDTQKYTLSEIAFLIGFNSASYFTKCFKDQYGKAPSEYLDQK